MSQALTGVGVSAGVGYGPAVRVVDTVPEPKSAPSTKSVVEEQESAAQALNQVGLDLMDRGARAGGEAQGVLEAQAMMAMDIELLTMVNKACDKGTTAARAVFDSLGSYADMLAESGSDYLAGRVADLHDIRARTVAVLLDVPAPGIPTLSEPSVLVAKDLAPADTALIDPAMVVGFVTEQGGPTSHTSILARNLGIPAVVGCKGITQTKQGSMLLLDGSVGSIQVGPDADIVAAAKKKDDRRRSAMAQVSDGPGETSDGHKVPLLANLGGPADVDAAVAAGAEGVGLFRTELCFLDREDAPGLAEQTRIYSEVLAGFPGKKVVVRTLDAGADKPLPFLPFGEEENPALGVRGLRICMEDPDTMRTQLSALKAAQEANEADLWVMAPMVATIDEARWFREIAYEVKLTCPIGVMIEIPAAAVRAWQIGKVADFFSIGSNDLTQYTFAADRQLGAVARLQDSWQPALLDLIAQAVDGGASSDTPVGVCGEAASDPALACVLVGLGVSTLSMSPGALTAVRAALAAHTLEQCTNAAVAARKASSPSQTRAAARYYLTGLADLGL
jgi:phosphotransferase system enzyme I (PtsI)